MPSVSLASFFELVQLAGIGLTIFRLTSFHLVRRYPFFFAYLLFRIPATLCTILLSTNTVSYFYYWIWTTPLNWILHILVVRELYGMILRRHRGIYTLGRWAIYAGVAIAIVHSILTRLPRFTPTTSQRSKIIAYYLAIDHAVYLSMAIFLILMLLLLSQYFSVVSRNVVAHAILFALLFITDSIGSIVRTTFGFRLYTPIDTARMGAWAVCALGWFFLLRAKGEEVRKEMPVLNLGHERRVLDQLDALNETLLRAGKNR